MIQAGRPPARIFTYEMARDWAESDRSLDAAERLRTAFHERGLCDDEGRMRPGVTAQWFAYLDRLERAAENSRARRYGFRNVDHLLTAMSTDPGLYATYLQVLP